MAFATSLQGRSDEQRFWDLHLAIFETGANMAICRDFLLVRQSVRQSARGARLRCSEPARSARLPITDAGVRTLACKRVGLRARADRQAHASAWPCVEARRVLVRTDGTKAERLLARRDVTKTEAFVIRAVPRHFDVGGECERV